MADWDTQYMNFNFNNADDSTRSQSSFNSDLSNEHKDSVQGDNASDQGLILQDGGNLSQESVTDRTNKSFPDHALIEANGHNRDTNVTSPGTAKAKAAKSPYAPSTIDSVPDEEITVPKDANLSAFTKEQIANFFRCLKVDDRIISHLYRKGVDGKRFSRLKDSELESIGLKNAVVLYFRDQSNLKNKKGSGGGWLL